MPYGVLHGSIFLGHMECFKMNFSVLILLPYGVLHQSKIWCHMEYSMGQIFGALWSASKLTLKVSFYWSMAKIWCHMEYSMGQIFGPYGVLQNELWSFILLTKQRWHKHSIILLFLVAKHKPCCHSICLSVCLYVCLSVDKIEYSSETH